MSPTQSSSWLPTHRPTSTASRSKSMAVATLSSAPGSTTGFKNYRWLMIGMIFMLTVINYIDRMTLSVLAPTIMEEFGMTNVAYSRVVTMFLIAYTISQSVSGKILDRIG